MDSLGEHTLLQTRRHFFGRTATGIGVAALASLLDAGATASAGGNSTQTPVLDHGVLGATHTAPRARRVIYLFMSGAPAQIDLFDYKPKMADLFDVDLPDSVRMGQRLTTMTSRQERFPVAPSVYKFQRRGLAGTWISELLPHTASIVDVMAVI